MLIIYYIFEFEVASYLPFGLVTVMLVGSLSFLVLVGLYRSAISISTDIAIHRLTKKSMLDVSFGSTTFVELYEWLSR